MKSKYVILVILAYMCLFPTKVFADTMVPARLVLENSGFTVQWDGQGITAANGEKTVNIPLNKNIIFIDNTNFMVEQPAVIIYNQMFVSQKILDLLGIMDNQILPYSSPYLTIQANNMNWDIKSCTNPAGYYTANPSNGVHWLVPEVSQDLINSIYNYFSYIFSQSNSDLRLSSNAYQELMMGIANGNNFIHLPVEERLSKAVINFDSSYANNKNNMNAVVALEYLNGQNVNSGEVFSFNKAVGPRTLERGFYVGHSISGDKMVSDVGGGVCRASTALYNAVLDANLSVIERHSHSLPVSYVPKDRDATVAWNIYDLKWKNDREYPITISTQGSNSLQLIVETWKVISPQAAPKVILDGNQLSFEVPPTIVNGHTLVPLRVISEALGAEVGWDGDTKKVTVNKASIELELQIGVKTAYKNGSPVTLDVQAKIISGRTLVPLRFVGEALGAAVDWDGTTQTITISS